MSTYEQHEKISHYDVYEWVLTIQDTISSDIIFLDSKIALKDMKVMSLEKKKNLQMTQNVDLVRQKQLTDRRV